MEQKLITISKYPLKFNYYVTSDGRIYSERTNHFMAKRLDKDGYEKVALVSTDNKRHRYSVHRLVMENFCPIEGMENLQVNHIDGDKTNNSLENLEWVTCKENIHHAMNNGLRHNQQGESNNACKVSEEIVKEIIRLLLTKQYTNKEISEMFGLSDDYAGQIKRKVLWRHLTKDIDFS